MALAGADAVASFNTPAPWLEMRDHFPVGQAIRGEHPQFQWGQNSFIVGAAPAGESTVLVAMPLPPKFAETAKQIQESQQRYVELARSENWFAGSTWDSFFFSRAGTVRLDLARAVSFQAGKSAGGCHCGGHGNYFQK